MNNAPLLLCCLLATIATAGCQHSDGASPAASATRPPVASSPVPPSDQPHRAPPAGSHGRSPRGGEEEASHVYRYDFVLTSNDPKDPPSSLTLSLGENQNGEVMVGRNVPLQVSSTPAPPGSKDSPTVHGVARQDVGLRIKAQGRSIVGSEAVFLEVGLEMSNVEPGPSGVLSVRKFTTHTNLAVIPGKSSVIASVDDEKRRFEFSVTPTKLR